MSRVRICRVGESQFAAALLPREAAMPEGLSTRSGRRDAARFAVYRNNVGVGLTRALERRYPVTLRLVGEDFFRAMAREYVALAPPTSPVMLAYGSQFPEFVENFPPAAGIAYLADVARLEDAMASAFHAADEACLAMDALMAIPPDQLGDVRLTAHPAARLVSSPHPVGTIYARHGQDAVSPVTHWCAETVLVTRPHIRCEMQVLPVEEAGFAAALFSDEALGPAAEQAASRGGFDFGRALLRLVSAGAFSAAVNSAEKEARHA
ncbi:HvfC/BufC N-terminal domain-containing protein [Jiella pelagia]|uniref:DNA-binding domain-containing protein n=1 Tax=Jiella pelagia TaxID=2986949 RepID=A0ABY7BTP0_9HYPH|nr:DNA-binding domain-containing protein [Jiella pelagia]WAP67057.1 DNA-binding domain-containing protein [Jiella pelagia]